MATAAAKYRLEIDGFPVIFATNCTLPAKSANLHSHQPGNQLSPEYGSATVTIEELTFRVATGHNQVDRLMDRWFDLFHRGLDTKRNARLVIFDRTGRTPLRTWEMDNCCPKAVQPEEHAGDSDATSEFTFTLQPEAARIV
ncbi:MAG TPA: hypothetical protein VGV38_02745 [Pyrinomonadaceae bacterium]|nr:hypothetical protein [Pyrinomonadaceae bacterium]